jgi:hypothetical protein
VSDGAMEMNTFAGMKYATISGPTPLTSGPASVGALARRNDQTRPARIRFSATAPPMEKLTPPVATAPLVA